MRRRFIFVALLSISPLFFASLASPQQAPDSSRQTESDEYTGYELLSPDSASFKIVYEVTATTAGAKSFYNPIRKGSVASDESVFDAMTHTPLKFEVVHGADARKDPLMSDADAGTDYIKVTLARPVPSEGQGRVLILKTYKDPKSYFREGDAIVFNRPLGVKRNKIILPAGYEVTACNVPSQVLTEPDGRIAVSFLNTTSAEALLILRAKPGAQTGAAAPHKPTEARSWEAPFQGETERARLSERAHQDRDIVYFLQQPETHSFSLYHDYTESRPGTDKYLNVVREGSTVSNPSAYILDTGEKLAPKLLTGAELAAAKISAGEETIKPETQIVVIPFPAVKAGESLRLRIAETYTAPDLIFDRSLGRPRNAVVLPEGWYLTVTSTPATITQLPDKRIRLNLWNDRPDSIDVLIKARRRVASSSATPN
jgi:hypothetical protein